VYNERLMPITGRVALITGANRGLGKAMALALAEAGARVALVARDVGQLNAVADQARQLGAEAEIFSADISDEAGVLQLERDVAAKFGPVDILINNAGIAVRKLCVDLTLSDWMSVLNTNLTSAFLLCRAFVPHMKGRGYGRIINISSIMGHISVPMRTAYSSSKAGLMGFTRALALEVAQDGITVVSISPGPFATEMTIPLMTNPEINEQFMSKTPMRRWGKPDEIGKLALYLCAEEAGFITGTDIIVDGGWCAQ
jgi:NAD(P)-dependent dehydrogenase (short-subunit alcohol dehydrogenase family)